MHQRPPELPCGRHLALQATLLLATLLLAMLLTSACGGHEAAPAAAQDQESSGGEGPLDRARTNIDGAHEDFKASVRPAAEKVDDKTREVVDEGKRAAEKVVDAVSD